MSQPFDDTTKSFYRQFFEQRGLRAISQYEVFARSRSIDLLVECPSVQPHPLADTVFDHFKQFNSVEFKGIHDPLTTFDFNRVMMRAWGIGGIDEPSQKEQAQDISKKPPFSSKQVSEIPDQRTVTIISVVKPVRILTSLSQAFQFKPTDEPGVYRCDHHLLPIWIVHPTELTIKPRNYPLLPLSRGEKLAQFIQTCYEQELVDYLLLTYDIGQSNDPDTILPKIMEIFKMTSTIAMRDVTWQKIDQSLIELPEAEEKLAAFIEKITAQYKPEWFQVGKSEGKIEGKAEGKIEGKAEGKAEGKIEGKAEGQQTILLNLLHKKFGDVPDDVLQQVRGTTDSEQLEQWATQILFVSNLAEMGFGSTS